MSGGAWDEFAGYVAENFGVRLTPAQIDQFKVYYRELVDCNKKFNLTTLVSEKDVLYFHFADSLACAPALVPALQTLQEPHVADIGAGAGFPGIPVKIAFPEISLTLIESNKKKCLFMDYVKSKIGLKGAEAVCGRAEKAAADSAYAGRYDFVFNRALANFNEARKLSLPFAKPGGSVYSWRAKKDAAEGAYSREYSLPGLKKPRYVTIIKNDTYQG